MTITPGVIERARSIIMIAAGAAKAPMVSRALGGFTDPKVIPAQLARRALWIVDQAAAGDLGTSKRD
jgi:6-phosphogluconolactonase/glucosamine-6-phosphate isomerase/deaminase